MKVLHFINFSGYNYLFTDLAKCVDRSRITLLFGSLEPTGDMQRGIGALGFKTFSLRATRRADYLKATARLAKLLRRYRVDVVHTHLTDASLVGLTAARLARVPVRVMTRHHSDERLFYTGRKGLMMDRIIGRYLADDVIAISKPVKRALMEIDGVAESKIHLVPNGYDWNRIKSNPAAALAVRREFGIENNFVLCAVGRLTKFKGVDVLLQAFAAAGLPATVRLLLVGGGDQEEWKEMARGLGIAGQCIFAGHRRDIFDVMSAADLFVHPSLAEAQSTVIIEALALARPVVATNVGAADEAIIPGRTGWLVPAQDVAALARSLRDAMENSDRARAYAQAGQQLVFSTYPARHMLDGYEAVYRQRLNQRKGARVC